MAVHPVARVVEREVRVYRRMWRGLAFSAFLAPILFLVAMGFGLGDLVDENAGDVGGVGYLEFIAPGLLVASAAQTAAGESLWPVLAGIKWMRFYQGMIATPMEAAHVYGGVVVWNGLHAVLTATAFLGVGAVVGAIPSWWAVLAVPAAALTACAVSAPIAAFSATQESDTGFPVVLRLVIQPLFLFSGAFFPISQLPSVLEAFVRVSPLYHGVELARAATLGTYDASVFAHVAVLGAFTAVGALAGTRAFARRLAA